MCNPVAIVVRKNGMRSILALSLFFAAATYADQPNLIVNSGFEQNGGLGTNRFTGWTVVDQAGGSGSWFAQMGSLPAPNTYRCMEEAIEQPPSGFAAMTTQSLAGSHILYQDVALPQTSGRIVLSFDLFLNSYVKFVVPNTLDYTVKANQQFRVDLLDPSAPVNDIGSGVMMKIFQTLPADSPFSSYQTYTYDLSPFAGRTIRLRFAEVDNIECFNAGLDNVSITIAECPAAAPSQLAISYHCPTGCEAGQPVSFVAASTAYVFQSCDAYAWDFGDGTTAGSSTPLHTFANPGTYTINLAVTNTLGTSSAQTTVTITPPPPRRRTTRH